MRLRVEKLCLVSKDDDNVNSTLFVEGDAGNFKHKPGGGSPPPYIFCTF